MKLTRAIDRTAKYLGRRQLIRDKSIEEIMRKVYLKQGRGRARLAREAHNGFQGELPGCRAHE
jgi:signal transduction histidine kinase